MDIWVFVGVLVSIYLIPGPDMLLVLKHGLVKGAGSALATATGLALARILHVGLAAFGLASLFVAAPWTYHLIKGIGGLYLVWIGIQILRNNPFCSDALRKERNHSQESYLQILRQGFLTNLLNPKALMFCSVLLPQFILANRGDVLAQFLLLGAILVGLGMLFDCVCGVLAERIGVWLLRYPLVRRFQCWLFGSLLITFGGGLILERS